MKTIERQQPSTRRMAIDVKECEVCGCRTTTVVTLQMPGIRPIRVCRRCNLAARIKGEVHEVA